MAYDLEEQEQIDTLKAWWKQNGNLIIWLLIAALFSYGTWTAWSIYQGKQAAGAFTLYEEVQRALTAKDNAKVQVATASLIASYDKTSYATMAALVAAKSAFDANDIKVAKSQLTWAVEHASTNEFKAVAKLRLAALSLDDKSYDEGLKVLAGEFPPEFEADVAERKADILVAQNKIADARASYSLALSKLSEKHPGRQLVQVKLDAIGGASEVKPDLKADAKGSTEEAKK
ncbi:MAG: tetratricopeptide repeat protein [Undibacterium sp.]|nr:tetratricopeptide repeat protein [Undibacterium sp.]